MLWLTGSTVHLVVVFGVVQIWPALELIANTGAGFMLRTTNPDAFSMGMVQVTGAASTFVISLVATGAWLRSPRPLLLIFVGYSLDLMSYISFPLLGVKRWILFGAPFSEVLMGLELLGVERGPVVLFELWYAGFMALVFLAAKRRRAAAPV